LDLSQRLVKQEVLVAREKLAPGLARVFGLEKNAEMEWCADLKCFVVLIVSPFERVMMAAVE
jgi:hypothetical protein